MKHYIALCGELAFEEAVDLSQDRLDKALCLVQCIHRDKVWKSSVMFPVIVSTLHYINTKPRAAAKIAKTHLKNRCTPNSSMPFPLMFLPFDLVTQS